MILACRDNSSQLRILEVAQSTSEGAPNSTEIMRIWGLKMMYTIRTRYICGNVWIINVDTWSDPCISWQQHVCMVILRTYICIYWRYGFQFGKKIEKNYKRKWLRGGRGGWELGGSSTHERERELLAWGCVEPMIS